MSVTQAKGWLASGVRAGTKPSGDLDLALVWSEQPATVAGAFTTSRVPSAHVILDKPRVATGRARGVIVSAGIANAFTGSPGVEDARRMTEAAAAELGADAEQMLFCATGTIGNRIPVDDILPAVKVAVSELSPDGADDAAHAIRTTDKKNKTSVRTFDVGSQTITVGGMAKGAGMIAPTMVPHATLLVFITTDGAATPAQLTHALDAGLAHSFNGITIDGCMSTSDTVLLFANGASGVDVGDTPEFAAAVADVMADLAYQVVSDGEGSTRVIRVRVTGAASEEDAYAAAREVASSVLVRSAVWGNDPNMGRVVQALGQAPVSLDPDKLRVAVGGVDLSVGGVPTWRTDEAAKILAEGNEALIEADLGLSAGSFEFLTCDLTPEYVTFNAEYTT